MNEISEKSQLEHYIDDCQKQETWIQNTVMGRIFKEHFICIALNYFLNSSVQKYLIRCTIISIFIEDSTTLFLLY